VILRLGVVGFHDAWPSFVHDFWLPTPPDEMNAELQRRRDAAARLEERQARRLAWKNKGPDSRSGTMPNE